MASQASARDRMSGIYGRRQQAAEKHLPGVRFALCGPFESPDDGYVLHSISIPAAGA